MSAIKSFERTPQYNNEFITGTNKCLLSSERAENPYERKESNMSSTNQPRPLSTPPDVSSILGVLFSYVGGEVATKMLFERLLWPQRFYNGFRLKFRTILEVATTMALGGPLHRAALEVLDELTENGLIKGRDIGDFLGTVFFPDSGEKYTTPPSHDEKDVRNGLLHRVALYIGHKHLVKRDPRSAPGLESGDPNKRANAPVRAIQVIVRLKVNCVPSKEASKGVQLDSEINSCGPKVYLGILTSETVSIVVGTVVAGVWRSRFSILWFLAALIKILSAMFTLSRSSFKDRESVYDQTTLFYIERSHIHTLIEGPDRLVRDFFRHYGHPIRNRSREVSQFLLIGAMGMLCPVGLVCLTWMPLGVRYCWLGTQLAVTCMFHFYRFSNGGICASTIELVGDELANGNSVYLLWGDVWIQLGYDIEEVPGVAEVRTIISRHIEYILASQKPEGAASSAISQAV